MNLSLSNLFRWLRFAIWRWRGVFPDWRKRGRFSGDIVLKWVGPRDYILIPNPLRPFRFERGTVRAAPSVCGFG